MHFSQALLSVILSIFFLQGISGLNGERGRQGKDGALVGTDNCV